MESEIYTALVLIAPFYILAQWDRSRFKPLTDKKKEATFYKELDGTNTNATLRRQVWKRDKGFCRVCGRKTYLARANPKKRYIPIGKKPLLANCHHCLPDDMGADAVLENLINTCERCNLKFSNTITAWSIDYQKKLWRQGKPYKLFLTESQVKDLYKPNWRHMR